MVKWNIRSLNVFDTKIRQIYLDLLTIIETKSKGSGILNLNEGHMINYNGVQMNKRAQVGIGCIIHKRHLKYLLKAY